MRPANQAFYRVVGGRPVGIQRQNTHTMSTKAAKPTIIPSRALISSCPDLSSDERLLLIAIADYDRISDYTKKAEGGFASLETLAFEIRNTTYTTRKIMDGLRKRGILLNLGTTKPGGPMRRRVVIPQEHADKFYERINAKKNKLGTANEPTDTLITPGEFCNSLPCNEKEENMADVVGLPPAQTPLVEGATRLIKKKKEIQRNPPGRDSSDTFSSPKPSNPQPSSSPAKPHKRRDWLAELQAFDFFPALAKRYSVNAGDAQHLVKKLGNGKLCAAELGFVLENFGSLNAQRNDAYPHEPYRPANIHLLMKNFSKILTHLRDDKREDVEMAAAGEKQDAKTAQSDVVQAALRSKDGSLHNPVGSQDTFSMFGAAEMIVFLASFYQGDRAKFLSLVCHERKKQILEDARDNPIGYYAVAQSLGINLVEVIGMETFEDMLIKKQKRIDYINHCREVINHLRLWTPGVFNAL
jgi:hypothetical protein